MEKTRIDRTLYARIAGDIWMPQTLCWKDVKLTDFRYSDGSQPSLRDMVLQATNNGDFQSCGLVDAYVLIRHYRRDRVVEKRLFLSPESLTISDCWASEVVRDEVAFA